MLVRCLLPGLLYRAYLHFHKHDQVRKQTAVKKDVLIYNLLNPPPFIYLVVYTTITMFLVCTSDILMPICSCVGGEAKENCLRQIFLIATVAMVSNL